jgi:hypothetical protein
MTTWDKIKLAALALLLVAIIGGVGWLWYDKHKAPAVVQIDQAHLTDIATLQQKLDLKTHEAQLLSTELEKTQNRDPDVRYIVQAPTVQQAATKVEADIKAGTSPANKIPADKTIVTPNTTAQKVDVYRVTLDKARWGVNGLVLAGGSDPVEIGIGPAYHNKDWGASAGGTSRGRYYLMGTKYF